MVSLYVPIKVIALKPRLYLKQSRYIPNFKNTFPAAMYNILVPSYNACILYLPTGMYKKCSHTGSEEVILKLELAY